MAEDFQPADSGFGQHRALEDPFYRWAGNKLMDTLVTYLENGWGTTVNSHGVVYGHFNEIVIWRSYLRGGKTELIESHLIPLLDGILEDLTSKETQAKSVASAWEKEIFLRDYSGYRELFIQESRKPNWLSFLVQRHFMAFAGDLDAAWRYCRRLDPNQPPHDYRHFHELARRRDEVFFKPSGATVTTYLEEVSRLRALGNYEELVTYVQHQKIPHRRMENYDGNLALALEDELTVNGLWSSISA